MAMAEIKINSEDSQRFDVFRRSIDLMISLNKENRDKVDKGISVTSVPHFWHVGSYVKQFGTVHINIGRRVGKTTYIINKASANDLIITRDGITKDHIKYLSGNDDLNICSATDISFTSKRNSCNSCIMYDNIWIDDPSSCLRCNSELIKQVYDKFIIDYSQTVIMLGE